MNESFGDGRAIAAGCIGGLCAGLGLGSGIALMLGGLFSEMGIIVILHTALAMTVMGGWTAPSLLPEPKG